MIVIGLTIIGLAVLVSLVVAQSALKHKPPKRNKVKKPSPFALEYVKPWLTQHIGKQYSAEQIGRLYAHGYIDYETLDKALTDRVKIDFESEYRT